MEKQSIYSGILLDKLLYFGFLVYFKTQRYSTANKIEKTIKKKSIVYDFFW